MPRCHRHPASHRCGLASLRRSPEAPADIPCRSLATAFRARLCGRIPSRVRWNASFPPLLPRTHLRFPAPVGTRADSQPCLDRPRDERRSSRLVRTAMRISVVDRLPLHVPAPPQSWQPPRHSQTPKPALRSPPTTARLRPGSQAETPPPASSNPRSSCLLLSRAVSSRKNYTARPARIQRETFHALLLVPFEQNRDSWFIHFKFIGRRRIHRNRGNSAGVRGARCVQQCDHLQLAIHNSEPVRDTQFVAPIIALVILNLFRRHRNRLLFLLPLFRHFFFYFFRLHQAGQIHIRDPVCALRGPRASQIAQA